MPWKRCAATVLEPGVVCVLTADSLSRAEKMFAFFTQHALHDISFSVEEQEGANASSSLGFAGVEAAMEDFLVRFMRTAIAARSPIRIREAERILALLTSETTSPGTNEQTEPLAALTIDRNGGIYTFSPEFTEHAEGAWAHLCLGNVHTHSMEQITDSAELRRLTGEINVGLTGCAEACGYWDICGGGAPVNRLAEHGSLGVAETQFCRLTVQATTRALMRVLSVD